MNAVSLEEAQARLPELIEALNPGEHVTITRNAAPVARITAETSPTRTPRRPGNCRGLMTIVADDDEHLRNFAEYMG